MWKYSILFFFLPFYVLIWLVCKGVANVSIPSNTVRCYIHIYIKNYIIFLYGFDLQLFYISTFRVCKCDFVWAARREGCFLCHLGAQENSSQDRLSSRDLPMSPVVGSLTRGSPSHLYMEAVGFVLIPFGCCTVWVLTLDFEVCRSFVWP